MVRRRRTGALDRSLNEDDYQAAGGVVGSLLRRADELLHDAEAHGRLATVRRLALRMVSTEGGRLARRRVAKEELIYADPDEQERVRAVTDRVSESRFVVQDDGYLEAAHDTLVEAWPQLRDWIAEAAESELPLLRAVGQAAKAWQEGDRAPGLLWTDDPRLAQLRPFRGELNRLEEEFVHASCAKKRRRRLVATGVVASYLGLLAAALWRR